MAYKVLVVDDSAFYRRRVGQILAQDPLLEVIGDAKNGQEAIEQVKSLKPDVVTMDVEMPIMDGISAVRQIMRQTPLPILMFSSLTHEGATATLDSLDAGALDFLPKNFEDIAHDRKEAVELLQSRVKAIARRRTSLSGAATSSKLSTVATPGTTKSTRMFLRSDSTSVTHSASKTQVLSEVPTHSSGKHYQLLAIGTSTGGPVALQKILTELPASFPNPIVLVQHMPGSFTKAFAERLDSVCQIKVKEAEDGDILRAGQALLAPGGKQMTLESSWAQKRVRVSDTLTGMNLHYKPSVDATFESIAGVYGGEVLSIILTGMGADGKAGCQLLKAKGATVWAQDEASSVVYGMPQAITVANIAQRSLSLSDIGSSIKTEMLA